MLYYIILCYIMLCYVILYYIIWCYIILYYIIWCYIILHYNIMLYYITLCYIILHYVILYYIMLYYIILCYIILYDVILYYVILCYVILYYIILYYTILFYIILYYTILCVYIYITYTQLYGFNHLRWSDMISKTTALGQKHWKPRCCSPCFCQDSCKNRSIQRPSWRWTPQEDLQPSIDRDQAERDSFGLASWHRPVTPGKNVGDPYSGGKERPPAPNSGGLGKIWKSVVSYLNHWIFPYIYIYTIIHTYYIYNIFPHLWHLGHLQFLTFAVFGAAQVRTCWPRSRTESTAGNLTTGRSVRSVRRSWPRWKIWRDERD